MSRASPLKPARAQRLIALERAGEAGLVPPPDELANYCALSTFGWADHHRGPAHPGDSPGHRFTLTARGREILAAAKKGAPRS